MLLGSAASCVTSRSCRCWVKPAVQVARNYRALRAAGFTVRKTTDLIIGTYCIEHRQILLHADRDFEPMREHLGLQGGVTCMNQRAKPKDLSSRSLRSSRPLRYTLPPSAQVSPPLSDALAHWHQFYILLGTAAGTLVGLLFVAASVTAGVFPSDRRAPLRVLSATVVHFSSVLIVSLILLAPIENWTLLGVVVLVCGLIGIAYDGLVCRDATRDSLMAAIDLEDQICYAVLPVVTYLSEDVSGIMLALRWAAGCAVLAISLTALLVVGIHNAWDIQSLITQDFLRKIPSDHSRNDGRRGEPPRRCGSGTSGLRQIVPIGSGDPLDHADIQQSAQLPG